MPSRARGGRASRGGTPRFPVHKKATSGRSGSRRIQAPASSRAQQAYEPGPWEYYPTSSRVSAARYDRVNQLLEVQWVDGGINYLYSDVPPSVWRNMNRVASVGKFVNRVLNQYSYAPKVDY
jgi:hypothetical protein